MQYLTQSVFHKPVVSGNYYLRCTGYQNNDSPCSLMEEKTWEKQVTKKFNYWISATEEKMWGAVRSFKKFSTYFRGLLLRL